MATRHRGDEEERVALDTFVKLNRCLSAVAARIAEECPLPKGLTVSRFAVLEALLHCGPLSQQQVAQKILRSRGDITMVVDHLEKSRLVRRQGHPRDRRCVQLELTVRGRGIIESFFPEHARCITRAMGVLSLEEQAALGALCRKLGLGQAGGARAGTGRTRPTPRSRSRAPSPAAIIKT
jgi:MarR family 2-MHQ and catechol resistance regulon transcriptional repressor